MLSFLFPQKGFGRCVNIGLCLCEHLPLVGKRWARSMNMFQNYTNEITLKSVLSTSENFPKSYTLSVLKVQTTRPWLSRVAVALPSCQHLHTPFLCLKRRNPCPTAARFRPLLRRSFRKAVTALGFCPFLPLPRHAVGMRRWKRGCLVRRWRTGTQPWPPKIDTKIQRVYFSTNSPRENLFNWKRLLIQSQTAQDDRLKIYENPGKTSSPSWSCCQCKIVTRLFQWPIIKEK